MANFVMTQGGETSIRDLLNEYFGFGGAAGGGAGTSGTTSGTAGLGAIGAAIAATIIKDKTSKAHLENLKPGTESKPIPNDIPSDLAEPGAQELPYLPNAETKPYTEVKPIPEGIPSDLAEPGVQELPYLPNAGTAEKEKTLPTIPPISEGLPSTEIKDETQTNIEQAINPTFDMQGMYDFILQQQQRQWEREDQIRAETQAREDNAWQRSVEDMRKAGVNPNLVNAGPAASGGGITQATGLDYSPWTAEINKQLALVEQEIENNFKGDENSKDRLTKGLTSLLQLFSLMALKG